MTFLKTFDITFCFWCFGRKLTILRKLDILKKLKMFDDVKHILKKLGIFLEIWCFFYNYPVWGNISFLRRLDIFITGNLTFLRDLSYLRKFDIFLKHFLKEIRHFWRKFTYLRKIKFWGNLKFLRKFGNFQSNKVKINLLKTCLRKVDNFEEQWHFWGYLRLLKKSQFQKKKQFLSNLNRRFDDFIKVWHFWINLVFLKYHISLLYSTMKIRTLPACL